MNGTVIDIYPLEGIGNMVIELSDVYLHLYADISIDDFGYIKAEGLQIDADFDDANLELENLHMDGDLAKSVSSIISR